MRSRTMAAVAAWTVTVAVLTGCSPDGSNGADGPDGPGRPEDARSSGSATSTATAGTDDASGDASSSPDVEPATGQQVRMESGISFRLTEGPDWQVDGNGTFGVVADAEVEGVLRLVYLEASEIDAETDDLEVAAEAALTSVLEIDHPTLRREADREVNGVTGYVLRAEDGEENFYLFGVLHEGTSLRISLEVPLELELEDWVEPVLASIEWP